MRYHTTITGHFNPENLRMMDPRFPQTRYVASHAIVKSPARGTGQYAFHVAGLGAADGTTTPPDAAQPVTASDDVSGSVLLHVAGAALVGAAAAAFGAHDVRASGPGALGLGGVAALFDAGRAMLGGKVTLGIGIGLAGALAITGGWILAKNQHGRGGGGGRGSWG